LANVFYLLLGWLLGLLSPIIHDRIKRHSAKKELEEGISNELKEIKSRMALLNFLISTRYETFDRKLLEWISKHAEEYEGKLSDQMLEKLRRISNINDEELSVMWQWFKVQNTGSALNLKTFRLPFVDSRMGSLSLLNVDDQKKIIGIRARINLVNDDIEQLRFYYQTTFIPGLTEENYNIILVNQKKLYPIVGTYIRDIVDMISDLMSK